MRCNYIDCLFKGLEQKIQCRNYAQIDNFMVFIVKEFFNKTLGQLENIMTKFLLHSNETIIKKKK